MIVTDGSPETYEDIFEKYNAPNYEVKKSTAEQVLVMPMPHLTVLKLFTALNVHSTEIKIKILKLVVSQAA